MKLPGDATPLPRTILGQQQVQGIDYTYTLQGWLKGVNSTLVNEGKYDIGQDGKIGSMNSNIARDAYGFSLNYFSNDYKSVGGTNPFAAITVANDLFNGNINAMVVNIPKLGEAKVYGYKYDQLNRLVAMDAHNGLNNANNVFTPITINDYKEQITYDANGNIKTYLRNGSGSSLNLNNYNYGYIAGTNRLESITNSVSQQTETYTYDEIGNTTTDGMQGVTNATWNVYGKLESLTNKNGVNVTYTYDAAGQRISKKTGTVEEWYVRDAAGNIMATYQKDAGINGGDLTLTESYKYGSNLLSVKDEKINVEHIVAGTGIISFERGNDNYILADANGNTKVTISDKKIQHSSDGILVDYYLADVRTATQHSSFGANVKTYNGGFAQANFNGQRKSLEIGTDAQTAQFWEYNGDVGRRWNVDPKTSKFPFVSSYATMNNNPIRLTDRTGAAPDDWYYWMSAEGKLMKREVKNNTNNVYLMNYDEKIPANDKYVLINQFNPKSRGNNLLMIAFVGDLIKNADGTTLIKEYGFSPNNSDKNALAYSRSALGQIFLNTNRKISSDYYDLLNSISHEVGHLKLKDNTLREHAEVYLYGFKDPSFSQSTIDHKVGTVHSFANYLYNIFDRENNSASIETIRPLLDKFKKLKTGISISYNFSGPTNRGGLNLYANGSLVDYKPITEKTHKK